MRHGGVSQPESHLMSLLIISVKLSQGLDGSELFPYSRSEPASVCIEWDVWRRVFSQTRSQTHGEGLLDKGQAAEMTDEKALDLNHEQLDQYMDWYETTWAQHRTSSKKSSCPSYHCSSGVYADKGIQ